MYFFNLWVEGLTRLVRDIFTWNFLLPISIINSVLNWICFVQQAKSADALIKLLKSDVNKVCLGVACCVWLRNSPGIGNIRTIYSVGLLNILRGVGIIALWSDFWSLGCSRNDGNDAAQFLIGGFSSWSDCLFQFPVGRILPAIYNSFGCQVHVLRVDSN